MGLLFVRKVCAFTLILFTSAASASSVVSVPGGRVSTFPALLDSPLLNETVQDRNDIVSFSDSAHANYQGNSNVLTLRGQAQLRRTDAILKGDEISFNNESGDLIATGLTRFYKGGTLITGTGLTYNINSESGKFLEPVFSLASGGSGSASEAQALDNNHLRMFDVVYSGCNCVDKFWTIKSPQVDIYDDENEGIAKDGVLYVKGVPVFWSPRLTFPIREEKKSGFLVPTYGYSSRAGYDLSIPYFINLAPNYDATITPRYLSKRGLLMGGEFRYLMPGYSGRLSGTYMAKDRETRNKRWSYSLQHEQHLGELLGFRFGLDIDWNRASDDNYFRDFTDMGLNAADETYLSKRISLNWSGHKYWNGSLTLQKYQTLQDETLGRLYGQYEKVPELMMRGSRYDWNGFDVSTTNTLTRFEFPTYFGDILDLSATNGRRAPDGTRFSSYSTVGYPIVRPGWYVTPKAGLHVSRYSTDWYKELGDASFKSQAGTQERSLSRVLPVLSVDSGMTFERNTTLFGKPSLQTFEPRLQYLYIPYKNQSDIPIYDTSISQFGFGSAFSENRYSGGWDRINNANQFTLGLTSRWLDEGSGFERLSLQFAQRFYLEDQKVTLPGETPRKSSKSDYLAGLSAALTDTLNTEVAVQMGAADRKIAQTYASLRWNPKRLTTVSLSYRYQQNPFVDETGNVQRYQLQGKETTSLSAQWPFTQNISGVGRIDYSIEDKRVTQSILGFEYKGDCCWTGRVVMQRYAVSKEKANSAIFLQLELSGLGSLGSDPMNLLRENVPGYESTSTPVPVKSTFERYE
ncbi:MAG: LPS-assembly protein LptD [Alcaligenaceae bacterium]|nr:LPS-assembly protein LptD [Alcaligenaceae bacterium]